jgi:tripartite-type tricarboxylate transporter receptor subunit TctC
MLRTLLAALLLCAGAAQGQAQTFPDRPLRMLVGYAAGGTTDIVGRLVAEGMGARLGQQIVVENRGGAGGIPAALVFLQQPADGYTLMAHAGGVNQAAALGTPMTFDPVEIWEPIGLAGTSALSLLVHPGLPVTTLQELVDFARAQGTPFRFGSPGVGLASAYFAQELGIDAEEIRYRGTGNVVVDLIAGRIQGYIIALPGVLTHVRSGAIRAVALASERRSHVMPELRTTVEQGFPQIIGASWFGPATRVGTPPERLARLVEAFQATMADPVTRQKLQEAGLDIPADTSAAFYRRLIREDFERWDRVARRAGLRQQ